MHPHSHTHMYIKCELSYDAYCWTDDNNLNEKYWYHAIDKVRVNRYVVYESIIFRQHTSTHTHTHSRIMLYDDGQGSLFYMTWTGIV